MGSGTLGSSTVCKGLTGAIPTMTTSRKAGNCTRDTGTMRTTIAAMGEAMTVIKTTMITTMTANH